MGTSTHYGPPYFKHGSFCTPYSKSRSSPHVICFANTVLGYLTDRSDLANHAVADNHEGNAPGQLRATSYLVCSVEVPDI